MLKNAGVMKMTVIGRMLLPCPFVRGTALMLGEKNYFYWPADNFNNPININSMKLVIPLHFIF